MAFVRAREQDEQGLSAVSQRFSLLLLEHNEAYLEDFSVFYYPAAATEDEAVRRKLGGRLRLCSMSLVFDPQDEAYPIMKFPFKKCRGIGKWAGSLKSRLDLRGDILAVVADEVVTAREHNIVAPYTFTKTPGVEYKFALRYAQFAQVYPQIRELYRVSTLSTRERRQEMALIEARRRELSPFDHSWLEDLAERIVTEVSVDRVTPLVSNRGRLLLTSSRIYFQPFNNVDPVPVRKYRLGSVQRIVKRRYLLRQIGLELFLNNDTSLFFAFGSQEERDRFHDQLLLQPSINVQPSDTENLTLRWQRGEVSNYDYLYALNSLADRSVNDLTQYPVFPWVISDYTSASLDLNSPSTFRDLTKPIGALDPQRLEMLQQRYDEMPEPKFLYGTHYSTPGYVLYYLVREAPEYMLCLQNGRFDQPDRMFCSVAETWKSVRSQSGDVKELIPEFYSESDFLQNKNGLNLGMRQDMSRVNDVQLPPWAKNASDFTAKCRQALECDYVSQRLHHWIDLIFGYKQRGPEAVKAANLFYYLTYEGAVDLDAITDPVERSSLEAQIHEFGQTPKQIFTAPHPARRVQSSTVSDAPLPSSTPATPTTRHAWGNSSSGSTATDTPTPRHAWGSSATNSVASDTPQPAQINSPLRSASATGSSTAFSFSSMSSALPEQRTALPASPAPATPTRTRQDDDLDFVLNMASSGSGFAAGRSSLSSSSFSETPKSASGASTFANAPTPTRHSTSSASSGRPSISAAPSVDTSSQSAWYSNVLQLRLQSSAKLHRLNVAAVKLSKDGETLFSASHDYSLKMFSLADDRQLRSINISEMALSSCALDQDGKGVIVGSWDNNLYYYSIEFGRITESWNGHDDAISCLALGSRILITASWDSTVKLWNAGNIASGRRGSIGSSLLCEFVDHDTEVKCVAISPDERVAISGAADGTVIIWDLESFCLARTISAHNEAINAAAFSSDGSQIVTTSNDCTAKIFNVSDGQLVLSVTTEEVFRYGLC
ncbi:neutral sphingomyelinase activation associated factor, variant 1 [Capsaspora owczarzaki ATCC 30864]|uniref:Neutral sphingomyelinase activation associated factor, variant 1 n=1 Tax=Capsaspora owczarzaki (strain ATCC 30864) TaxID=595528 RepID=A0A0D2X1E4_CAPO3|nr:neutral sphingomyelinase activation associated factor, variant 1 [Capsaspora owczarzaki ATCC 30864]